jgi:hypothetical protein
MTDRTPVRAIAALVASALLLLGVLGFVPGITTHYGELHFAGRASHARLFDVFRVSILLDLVHVLSGLAGLALARTAAGARTFLVDGGAAYLGLWLLGAVAAGGWIPLNAGDNWLHFAGGLAMLALAFVTTRERTHAAPAA